MKTLLSKLARFANESSLTFQLKLRPDDFSQIEVEVISISV